jgi:hypothetical protein
MRNCSALLISIALCSCALFAQTVRVPFIGCPADTQKDPEEAPRGTELAVQTQRSRARKLAYYKSSVTPGILAPRGWHCLGVIGSGGSSLFVSPEPIKVLFGSGWSGIEGPAVEIDDVFGGTSGRFDVAEVIARVFPAQRAFVQNVIDLFDQPASEYTFAPYPKDKLIVQADRLVRFQTPPHSEGLGTMNRLRANADPIDGIALLEGQTPDLLMLRVRLPPEQRDLSRVIIQELLVRQRRDAR